MGKRITLISLYDYCGSGYRIAECVNLNSNHFVEYFVFFNDGGDYEFKRYPALLTHTAGSDRIVINVKTFKRINKILQDCDIVHFKGDNIPSRSLFNGLLTIPDDIPIVLTTSGSSFRNPGVCGRRETSISTFTNSADIRTTINPDLNYPEFKATYVPFAYDFEKHDYCWKNSKVPLILHTPSDKTKKGTSRFVDACELLKKDGYTFDYKIITDKKHDYVLSEKKKATIFFDQVGCGSYGNAAVEAMAYGIPVITYLPDSSVRQANGLLDDTPVINCGNTVESIKSTISKTLNKDLSEISRKTRDWGYKTHSYPAVANKWSSIYESA